MLFISLVDLNVSQGEHSLGIMPASSLLCLVSSSPSPLSANIASTIAFSATASIWAMVSVIYARSVAIF